MKMKRASEAGVTVDLRIPPPIAPWQPAGLLYQLTDETTGQPLTDLVASHEKLMHLIVVSSDLTQFQHLHPSVTESAGEYRVEVTFPVGGAYVLFPDFTRADGSNLYDRKVVEVGSGEWAGAHLVEDA